ncbi:hypothetical protein C8J56DRAFT_924187 [Mycena floridula]|nr:hypothetical protein C8J56DRAFT_924187 [Mycena floridula]
MMILTMNPRLFAIPWLWRKPTVVIAFSWMTRTALAVLNAVHPYVKLEIVYSSVAQRELLRRRSRIQRGYIHPTPKARYFFGSDA